MIRHHKPLNIYVREKWRTEEQKTWWYSKHTAVRRAKLIRLSEQQGHRCAYCGHLTWLLGYDGPQRTNHPHARVVYRATLEHVIPQSQGGTDSLFNLVMACAPCNSYRSSMPVEQFVQLIQHFGHVRYIPSVPKVPREEDPNHISRKGNLTWGITMLMWYQPQWLPLVDEFLKLERPG